MLATSTAAQAYSNAMKPMLTMTELPRHSGANTVRLAMASLFLFGGCFHTHACHEDDGLGSFDECFSDDECEPEEICSDDGRATCWLDEQVCETDADCDYSDAICRLRPRDKDSHVEVTRMTCSRPTLTNGGTASGSETGSSGGGGAGGAVAGEFGDSCASNADCASGECLDLQAFDDGCMPKKFCTEACTGNADCPALPGEMGVIDCESSLCIYESWMTAAGCS